MEEYLPPDVIPVVLCYVLNEDPFLKDREGVDITICCNDNRVVELYNKQIVEFCNVSFLSPSCINIFYAYDPFIKYYIIQDNCELIILKRTECYLKLFNKFSSVQKYEINDFLKVGKPQVKIWLVDEMEPVVTDFSDSLNNVSLQDTELSLNLNKRLNVMKICLKEINSVCENKKLCCDKALSNFKKNVKNCVIDLKKSWQKVVDDFWIVCMFVENVSDRLVSNLYLLNDNMQIETKIFQTFDTTCSELQNFALFNSVTCLPPHSTAYVVGILSSPVPNFKFRQVISKSFLLLYNIENKTDNYFEEIKLLLELDMVELVNGNLGICNHGEVLMEDVITTMVVNEEIVLEIKFKNDTESSNLENILIKKLNFLKIKVDGLEPFCFIVAPSSNSFISRFMLFMKEISPSSFLFKCYPKNYKHLSLFVNVFGNFVPSILSVCQKNKTFKDEVPILAAVNKLDDEFKYFSSVMKYALLPSHIPLQTESKLQFTAAMWKELLESRLQFDTDLKFQNCS